MPFKVPTDIARLSDAELADLIAEGNAEFDQLLALESPSDEEVREAERLSPLIKQLEGETVRRQTAAGDRVTRMNAVRAAHTTAAEPAAEPEPEPEPEQPAAAAVVEPAIQLYQEDLVQAGDEPDVNFAKRKARYPSKNGGNGSEPDEDDAASGQVIVAANGVEVLPRQTARTTVAARTARPARPQRFEGDVIITASADVPDFATGSRVEGIPEIAQMVVNRMKGFPAPAGQKGGQMHQYGVCTLRPHYPEELICAPGKDDYDVIMYAASERRLPGGSLVAAGQGWCAPSETLYALCEAETTEGMLSVPEVQVSRGGIKFTKGPDYSAIYTGSGFCLTEAQAIAGNTKPCYEVPCPTFTEIRLDSCGLCIKVPILLNAAYPELTQRTIRGALVAFQHQMNAKVLAAIATSLSPAVVMTKDYGGTFIDTLAYLELQSDALRTKYRLSFNETLEVVLPMWVQGAIQNDLANRTGNPNPESVSDAQVSAAFSARQLNVQWVYDWQDLASACPTAYPATVNAAIYPAGTFVKGVADVINLNAVYDAASLSTNYYTGLFMEQGVLIANTCFSGCLVTIPICNAGRTGAHDVTCP